MLSFFGIARISCRPSYRALTKILGSQNSAYIIFLKHSYEMKTSVCIPIKGVLSGSPHGGRHVKITYLSFVIGHFCSHNKLTRWRIEGFLQWH